MSTFVYNQGCRSKPRKVVCFFSVCQIYSFEELRAGDYLMFRRQRQAGEAFATARKEGKGNTSNR